MSIIHLHVPRTTGRQAECFCVKLQNILVLLIRSKTTPGVGCYQCLEKTGSYNAITEKCDAIKPCEALWPVVYWCIPAQAVYVKIIIQFMDAIL